MHTTYTCIYIYTYACGSNKTRTPCNDPFPADLSRGVARLGRCRDFGCGGAFVQDFSDPWGPQIGMSIVSHLIFGVPNFDPYLYIYIYTYTYLYIALLVVKMLLHVITLDIHYLGSMYMNYSQKLG